MMTCFRLWGHCAVAGVWNNKHSTSSYHQLQMQYIAVYVQLFTRTYTVCTCTYVYTYTYAIVATN